MGICAANWVIRRRHPKSDNYLKRCNLLAIALLVVVVVVGAKYPCNDRAYFQAPIIPNRLRRRVSTARKSITYLPNGPRSANSENREYRSSHWKPDGVRPRKLSPLRNATTLDYPANSTRFCSVFCELIPLLINECIAYSVFCNLSRHKPANEVCITS